ncbi:MAG TPA: permease-like cell division protein FtsX [Candidatus Paceibacterota bacterium]|nr:permease-like cell division protein FtsX [Candidatus Paceibacterota bacterium]
MTKLIRIIKAGFLNFKRSGTISFAAVLVMTITLSVITAIILLQAALNFSLNEIKEKVDVTVYFNVGADDNEILAMRESLLNLPEVESATYISAEEALALFRQRHEGDYATLAALDEIGGNPLGAYLNVKAKDISQYESLANTLKSDNVLSSSLGSIVDKVNYHDNKLVIDRLNSIISGAERLGILITLILIVISVVITLNTIRLAIFISREEIGVMRLVGASKTTVRGPFMIEGIIYGIIATIITLIIFIPITSWLGKTMTNFLGLNLSQYFMSNFFQIMIILLFSGGLLGIISSTLAVRRYLNK